MKIVSQLDSGAVLEQLNLKNILVTGGIHHFIEANQNKVLYQNLMNQSYGNFKPTELIHRSELSCVFLAERIDEAFDQKVIIKVLVPHQDEILAGFDFINEWKILARLNHKGIAKIYDASVTDEGYHYMIMEYIKGQEIDDYCDQNNLTINARIGLFLQVLDAVECAHENMVMHKDIKPGNILVQPNGEIKLLDFGIASIINDDDLATNQLIYTPAYASPEQINASPINSKSDIYQLGLLLYKLLVGQQPFANNQIDIIQLSEKINNPERISPSQFYLQQESEWQSKICLLRRTKLSRLFTVLTEDLDHIVIKSIDSNPAKRYSSVAEMRIDLRNFINDKPVSVSANNWGYVLKKSMLRNFKAFVFFAIAGLTTIIFTVLYIHDIKQQKELTILEKNKTEYITQYLINLLQNTDDQLDLPNKPSLNELVLTASKQLMTEPKVDSDINRKLVLILANSLTRMQNYDQALNLLLSVVNESNHLSIDEQIDFELNTAIGRAYYDVGEITKARNIYENLLANETYKTINDLERGTLHRYRAEVFRKEQDYKEALIHTQMAIDKHSASVVSENKKQTELIQDYNLMGGIQLNMQDYNGAKLSFEQATTLMEANEMDETVTYITIAGNLAILFDMTDEPQKAEAILNKTINKIKDHYPERYSLLASHINTLSSVTYHLKQYGRAIDLVDQSIEIYTEHYGTSYHKLLSPLKNKLMYLLSIGQCGEAKEANDKLNKLKIALQITITDEVFSCEKSNSRQILH